MQEKVLERQTVELDARIGIRTRKKRKPGRANSQPAGCGNRDSMSARVGRFVFRIVANDWFAGHLAAALPASVPVFILRRRNEPKATARLTQNC